MRAAWYDRPGPAAEVLVLGELPTPDPGAGEVLVRVRASGINPSDTKKRAGWRDLAPEFPRVVPHSDGAGVIEAVGEGVDPGRLGERVWLYNAQRGRAHGTCAAQIALPAAQAVRLPDRASFEHGACLGVPASTAHFAVFADGPVEGQTVLVQGGAGAVGHAAIQLAVGGGARVLATVSSQAKADHALAGGAAAVIDYRQENVVERVMALTGRAGVERIVEVDLGANLANDVAVIRANGVIASYSSTRVPEPVLPYYPLAYKGVTLRLVQAYILPPAARAAAIAAITAGLEAGELRPALAATCPLEQVAAAHELVESGQALGNVVVTLGAG